MSFNVSTYTTIIPRDYQIAAIDSIYNFFRNNPKDKHPIVLMPTGTGKSVVIAEFLRRAFLEYPYQKVIIATHVKELVAQNYKEFMGMWPQAPAGVYSSGLKRKDLYANITFAGVQSIFKHITRFGKIDLFIIDECHLLSPNENAMYMKCIKALMAINPFMKVIGFTATDWREGIGKLTDGGTIFTDVCIDMCSMESFNWFLKQGYLLPVVPKKTEIFINVEGVKITAGEYNLGELEKASNKDEITFAALQETVKIAKEEGRDHWLVFGAGLEHCQKIYEMLQYLGVSCRVVHSKMSDAERDQNIQDFKDHKFTALINNGILTTGYNDKAIDLIVMLRATASSKLWVQMLGRGTRPDYAFGFDLTTLEGRWQAIYASQKQNCLVLDFARNSERLGPINDPVIPKKKGEGKGEIPIKICDGCGMYNHISARYCGGVPYRTNEGCGEEFIFKVKIAETASTAPLIAEPKPIVVEVFEVDHATYATHTTRQGATAVKVGYVSGIRRFMEYLLFDGGGPARMRAVKWWKARSTLPVPSTTKEALDLLATVDVNMPTHIRVRTDTEFKEVVGACFTGEFATPVEGDEIPF